MALEQRSPLVVLRHEHKGWKQDLPVEGAGFLAASPAGVAVLTVRPGPAPGTYLVRVHNTTDQDVTARLQFPHTQLADAYLDRKSKETHRDILHGDMEREKQKVKA